MICTPSNHFFHLWPQFDQAADGLGAGNAMRGSPSIKTRNYCRFQPGGNRFAILGASRPAPRFFCVQFLIANETDSGLRHTQDG